MVSSAGASYAAAGAASDTDADAVDAADTTDPADATDAAVCPFLCATAAAFRHFGKGLLSSTGFKFTVYRYGIQHPRPHKYSTTL